MRRIVVAALALLASPAAAQPARAPGGELKSAPHGLGKTLWVIMSRPVDAKLEQATIERHLAHQNELERQGIMFAAGPLSDPDGSDRIGFIIIRARDEAEARKIADSDPMHIAGARKYVLKKWLLNEGTIGLKVHYSHGTVEVE